MNSNQKARSVAYVLGSTTIACSGFGLYFCYGIAQSVATGDFISVLQEHDARHFYEAFWIMLSVSVLWCLCLGWCGLDQIQLKLARFNSSPRTLHICRDLFRVHRRGSVAISNLRYERRHRDRYRERSHGGFAFRSVAVVGF